MKTLLLICLLTTASLVQNKVIGSWFVICSDSYQSQHSDSSKTESISKTDTTPLSELKENSNQSSTTLNFFLNIKKNGRFKINGVKNYRGA
jgi:hypothetical protein